MNREPKLVWRTAGHLLIGHLLGDVETSLFTIASDGDDFTLRGAFVPDQPECIENGILFPQRTNCLRYYSVAMAKKVAEALMLTWVENHSDFIRRNSL